MFSAARLKLTAWYLLIIMIVSFLFSLVIYFGIGFALKRRFVQIENRLLKQKIIKNTPPPIKSIFFEDLRNTKRQVFFVLLVTNGVILVISAAAGYFLAGRTLRPIESMVHEQNRFVSDASHEIRTPIAAMKVSTEVALRDKNLSTNEAKKVLSSNMEDLDGLQKLADNLLSLSQYQAGSSYLNFQKTNIRVVLENVIKKVSKLAEQKRIDINLNTGDNYIYADELSLEEMFLIFIDNSLKYTPEGGSVYIETRPEGRYIVTMIKDTGKGIDNRDLPHIFERFYRADKSRTKLEANGAGLGLSLAKKIIELHDGYVFVSSKINKGTIFTIKLPIKKI